MTYAYLVSADPTAWAPPGAVVTVAELDDGSPGWMVEVPMADRRALQRACPSGGIVMGCGPSDDVAPKVVISRALATQLLAERKKVNTSITHEQRDATVDALEAALGGTP